VKLTLSFFFSKLAVVLDLRDATLLTDNQVLAFVMFAAESPRTYLEHWSMVSYLFG
jgi:hypothetical protein